MQNTVELSYTVDSITRTIETLVRVRNAYKQNANEGYVKDNYTQYVNTLDEKIMEMVKTL